METNHITPFTQREQAVWRIKEGNATHYRKMLIQHLKQLEADELVLRQAMPIVPPHVTYSLTDSGIALKPVLHAMANWAIQDGKKRKQPLFEKMDHFPF